MTRARLRNVWNLLSSTLWFVPSAMTVLAVAAAAAAIAADRTLTRIPDSWFFLYSAGAEGARSVLSTIAGSMITVAGVAFSVTMVALSFASSELGPRLLRNFMRDRGNQIVLGTFIATFVYCLLVLRTVSESPRQFVPHIGVTGALVLALASLAVPQNRSTDATSLRARRRRTPRPAADRGHAVRQRRDFSRLPTRVVVSLTIIAPAGFRARTSRTPPVPSDRASCTSARTSPQ